MKARLPFLDILRFFAILLVLGRHGVSEHGWLSAWNTGGWVGVDLFFVLSGFLVGGILFRELRDTGRIRLSRFYIRRGMKIFPAFFAFLIVTLAIQLYFGARIRVPRLLSTLFLYSNYRTGLWGHLWSLCVEEHFYLLLPLFLAVVGGGRRAPRLILVTMLATLLFRLVHGLLTVYDDITHTTPTHLRIDSLLCGVGLAYYGVFESGKLETFSRRYRRPLLLAGVALFVPAFVWRLESTEWMATIGFTLNYAAAACLVVAGTTIEMKRNLFSYIGERSYSIYLWHAPILYWGIAYFQAAAPTFPTSAIPALYFLIAISVGILLANLIELPVLRHRP